MFSLQRDTEQVADSPFKKNGRQMKTVCDGPMVSKQAPVFVRSPKSNDDSLRHQKQHQQQYPQCVSWREKCHRWCGFPGSSQRYLSWWVHCTHSTGTSAVGAVASSEETIPMLQLAYCIPRIRHE